jgi:hypothetical protein
MASHPAQTSNPAVARPDQFALRRRFLPVAIYAGDRVEFAKAVFRGKGLLLYRGPFDAIDRRRATLR